MSENNKRFNPQKRHNLLNNGGPTLPTNLARLATIASGPTR